MRRFSGCLAILACAALVQGCTKRGPALAARPIVVTTVASSARPLQGVAEDYDQLFELIGDNRFVLLGESTHGTQEFYRERARITRRLIEEKGFSVIAVEADWADAYDVNEYIHGQSAGALEATLNTFERFPSWMWNNAEVRNLVAWLRTWNLSAEGRKQPVGFYGLDLYNVPESAQRVIEFLQKEDSAAAARARNRYKCFDRLRQEDLMEYGRRVAMEERAACAEPAAAEFLEMSSRVLAQGSRYRPGDEALVSAWQNARVVMSGEAYYRFVYAGGVESWNLRDRHMADTLDALSEHLDEGAPRPAKVVVWAHNSHLGDARVTERTRVGEWNVGQLMRQRHDGESVLVGFTTYAGTVRAASTWGGRSRVHRLKPALRNSFAALFHETGVPAFLLMLRNDDATRQVLAGRRLERFVGVVYQSSTERESHYYEVDLAHQFDAVVHIDQTTSLEPLEQK